MIEISGHIKTTNQKGWKGVNEGGVAELRIVFSPPSHIFLLFADTVASLTSLLTTAFERGSLAPKAVSKRQKLPEKLVGEYLTIECTISNA